MKRCAVFVDAGYLFAEGGKLCCGSGTRSNLRVDADGIVARLCALGGEAGISVLRTYWYDGARQGVPTTQQLMVAELPNVKLRLGRVTARGQQKGVDSLIYRDLMTLSRERAITHAVLLSGDEDLREGVRAAQDLGVQVVVVGIATSSGKSNQSRELMREADVLVELGEQDLAPFILRRTGERPKQTTEEPETVIEEVAVRFANGWCERVDYETYASLLASAPRIPASLDGELMRAIEDALVMSMIGNDRLRRVARSAFWKGVRDGGTNDTADSK